MENTASPYLVICTMIILATLFAMAPLLIAYVLAPKKPGRIKNDTYECGLEAKGDPWVQFKMQYYIYALVFVIFDVEAAFLYPWAVAFTGVGLGGFVAMMIFILILLESLVYLWIKGVLEWK